MTFNYLDLALTRSKTECPIAQVKSQSLRHKSLFSASFPDVNAIVPHTDWRTAHARVADQYHVPLFTTADFNRPNPDIVRVVVPFQGARRMAWSYWMAARMALKLAPEAEQRTTAIVNLHFQVSVHLDSARSFHCLASLLQMQRQTEPFFSLLFLHFFCIVHTKCGGWSITPFGNFTVEND
jgi:hypothetical protein